jgi:ribonucleoside-diphosphate reductase alpha chain
MYNREEVNKSSLEYFNGDELAANVFTTKYALKSKSGEYLETTPDDMHKRIAKEFARIESKFGGESALDFQTIYNDIKDFKYIVPQGSPMYGIGNNETVASLSNCVVVASPEDSVSSIVDSGKHLANLFKRRCGVGVDISNLRPEGMTVNNSAGTTTGAWSFADFYSYVCRMIGQNGRRGALMISIDVRHPDVEKFVTMKHDLTKVTGANVSIRISDDFMEAVEQDQDFTLKFPVDSTNPTYSKTIRARDLWKNVVDSATKTAEPGLLMWGNIEKFLPAQSYAEQGFKTLTTNPCGEIPLSAYDSCRLISVNLKSFVVNPFESNSYFHFEKFESVVKRAMRLSDDLVELEFEKLTKIIGACDGEDEKQLWTNLLRACTDGRRTGLGTHGLADALACLGMPYDSADALVTIDKIYNTLKESAYTESVWLARERGSFPVFNWELEKDNGFIKSLSPSLQNAIKTFGRRNISILTNAPTGSVSIMSQTSSGLEPVFRNFYIRRRKLSHNEQDQMAAFVDVMGDRWTEYKVYHHNVQEYLKRFETDQVPAFFTESDKIDWKRRVEIQGVIQKHIDHSISSTINLPKGTSPDVVSELYLLGWKLGLKGVTVYVDGSRDGVLITETTKKESFPQHNAPKRPATLETDIHNLTIKGEKWTILVGVMDGKPYEVLGGENKIVDLPKNAKKGQLVKVSTGKNQARYDLIVDDLTVKDVSKVFDNPNYSTFTRLLSLSLRHGAPINYVVEQMQKEQDSDMFSFARSISRVLKQYVPDGTKATGQKTCPECNSTSLIYQDGCVTCSDCGNSKCG